MKIDKFVMGAYANNVFVLRSDERKSNKCIVIDTALENADLMAFLKQEELEPVALLITHGHADHLAGVRGLKTKYPDMKICIHGADAHMLTDAQANLSAVADMVITAPEADIALADGAIIDFADITLDVLHTPGHTPGGVCFYSSAAGVVFTGDTLFAGGIGRTDFEYGNTSLLLESIGTKLLKLPEATRIYPGHGPETTLRNEKKYNRFISREQ